jgi:hypothetical protein
MSPHLFWRRLIAACRRERARRVRRAVAPLADKPKLARELLETLAPQVLSEAGYLRRRVVRRRRVAYARIRLVR